MMASQDGSRVVLKEHGRVMLNKFRVGVAGLIRPRKNLHVKGMIFAENRFGHYCVPAEAAHRPAGKYILAGKAWEPETVQYVAGCSHSGDVVTAGAFFGDSLPAFSLAAGENTVWAFEPNPENFRCASITVLLNGLKNVRLMNAGLGERSESGEIVIRDFSGRSLGGASQIVGVVDNTGQKRGDQAVPVEIMAIDDIVPEKRPISLIQLDVEDFEEFAIRGAAKTIARCRPKLILESIPQEGSQARKVLNDLGYSVSRRLDSENFLLEC
jgi:FkbM family methyltransferase